MENSNKGSNFFFSVGPKSRDQPSLNLSRTNLWHKFTDIASQIWPSPTLNKQKSICVITQYWCWYRECSQRCLLGHRAASATQRRWLDSNIRPSGSSAGGSAADLVYLRSRRQRLQIFSGSVGREMAFCVSGKLASLLEVQKRICI